MKRPVFHCPRFLDRYMNANGGEKQDVGQAYALTSRLTLLTT